MPNAPGRRASVMASVTYSDKGPAILEQFMIYKIRAWAAARTSGPELAALVRLFARRLGVRAVSPTPGSVGLLRTDRRRGPGGTASRAPAQAPCLQ